MNKKAEAILHVPKDSTSGECHAYDELARMFLSPQDFVIAYDLPHDADGRFAVSRRLYHELAQATGRGLPWGILTGVKPLKLYAKTALKYGGDPIKIAGEMRSEYFVSEPKIRLLADTWAVQRAILPPLKRGRVSVYVGIPFCPSRCVYCAFTTEIASPAAMESYMAALHKEITFVGKAMAAAGMLADSLYVGGGTPTALTETLLTGLLSALRATIPLEQGFEYTVEAGRPDTLSDAVCGILKAHGVGRVSINPQSMNAQTLQRIGRMHDAEMIKHAFKLVRSAGIPLVNADLIAGLPGEDASDFEQSMKEVFALAPENITIHTLAAKKGSKLREDDADFCYNSEGRVAAMLAGAPERMANAGYQPYYLYRQKQMLDNLENVGYALPGAECVYNMRIMAENQTIIALGASGSSKIYFPCEDRLERVFNIADPALYAARIDEMIERKRTNVFQRLADVRQKG